MFNYKDGVTNNQAMIKKFNSYYKINWLNDESLNFRELNQAIKWLMDKGYNLDSGSFIVTQNDLTAFLNKDEK